MPTTQRPLFTLAVIPGAAGTGNTDLTMTRPGAILDCVIVPTVTDGGSVGAFSRQALGAGSFNVITNSMAFATSGTIARTTTVTTAERLFDPTDVIRWAQTSGGAGTCTGRAHLIVVFTAISGAA